MAGLTRNLRLRLEDNLTESARYNLERIDQLGSVFPIGSSAAQTINSSSDIYLNANATTLGGDGNGNVFAPNLQLSSTLKLESGPYTFSLQSSTQTGNVSLTLPGNAGSNGQFLQTNGSNTLTWADPPTSNFASLNDTTFSSLTAGQVPQYNGSKWVNVNIGATRKTGVFDWITTDGNTKAIVHNFGTTNIQVWIYEPESSSQVFIQGIDFLDSNTILLEAIKAPESDYKVHLVQTI